MANPSRKLVAVSLNKASKAPLLHQVEELYVYGVLSQLARFTAVQYKDLATVADRIILDARLSYDEILEKLKQICQTTRTHYLFTGVIAPSISDGTHISEIKVTFRLYAAKEHRYIVDEVLALSLNQLQQPASPDNPIAAIPVAELNGLINMTADHFARAIFGNDPNNRVGTAPFSNSLKAMQLVLGAHQVSSNAEKLALYTAALQEDAQLETAYYHLARIYRAEGDYEKSVVNYRKTLEVGQSANRNRAILSTEAGIACALLGKPDYALQWWVKAIEYEPTYINPYFNIANVYEDRDDYTNAEKFFLKAQQLAPDDFRTCFNLARIYSKMGAWEKALTQYRYQLQTEDADPWCHSDVATCYLHLGDSENARVHLQKTVQLDPEGEAGQYAQLILVGLG
jgi:tetratricopeptide (TPR) repeat protein